MALSQSGTGTTFLTNGGNTDSGATTVSNGVLQVGITGTPGSIGAGSLVNVGKGTTLRIVNVSGGSLDSNITNTLGGVGTVEINSTDLTELTGAITNGTTGTLVVMQDGPGTTILSNAGNTYTGATLVSDGVLRIGGAGGALSGGSGSIGAKSIVTVSNGGELQLFDVHGNIFSNNVSNGAGGVGTVNGTTDTVVTLSGTLTDASPGQLQLKQTGSGATILTNAGNSYSGATTVTNGLLEVGSTAAAGSIGPADVSIQSTGVLSLVNVHTNVFANNVGNGLSGTGILQVFSANTITLSGTLTDGGAGELALSQFGKGTTILTNAGNTYSGPTVVAAGILQIGTATEPGSIGETSAVGVSGGGTLLLVNVNGDSLADDIENGEMGVGTVEVKAPATITLSGALTIDWHGRQPGTDSKRPRDDDPDQHPGKHLRRSDRGQAMAFCRLARTRTPALSATPAW